MDIEMLYHLGIATSAIATTMATLTAIIYTWVCTKTRPLKLPTVALTGLLWMFASIIAWRLYVVLELDCLIYSYAVLPILMVMVTAGYSFFLVGTFKDTVLIDGT